MRASETLETLRMKTTLFVLFLLCTTAALAQSGAGFSALSSEPYVLTMPTHEAHAYQHALQSEQSLLITGPNTAARGERPLWEAGAKPAPEVPLGDVARLYRGQHATAKKAVKVLAQ